MAGQRTTEGFGGQAGRQGRDRGSPFLPISLLHS